MKKIKNNLLYCCSHPGEFIKNLPNQVGNQVSSVLSTINNLPIEVKYTLTSSMLVAACEAINPEKVEVDKEKLLNICAYVAKDCYLKYLYMVPEALDDKDTCSQMQKLCYDLASQNSNSR